MTIQNNKTINDIDFGGLKRIDDTLHAQPRHKTPSVLDDDLETPWSVYYKIERETRVFFELDPFASDQNAKCSYHFTKQTNAFATEWVLPDGRIPKGVFVNHPHSEHKRTLETITRQYITYGFPIVDLCPVAVQGTTYWDYYVERFKIGSKPEYEKYQKFIKVFPYLGSIKFQKNGINTDYNSRNRYCIIQWLRKVDCVPNINIRKYFK